MESLAVVPVPPASEHSGEALAGLLVPQRQAARDADWPTLLQLSLNLLGAAHGHGVAIRAVRGSAAVQAEAAVEMAAQLQDGLAELAARDDHAAQAQGIREHLQGIDASLATRAGPLLDQVAAGSIEPGPFEEGRASAAVLGQAAGTELEAGLCVAAAARGLLGLVHWVVNTADPGSPDLSRFDAQLEAFQQAHAETAQTLRAGELALHTACADGRPAAVEAEAAGLSGTVQEVVVPFAAQQTVGRGWVAALRQAGRGGDAEQIGRVLAADALLLRRAIADAAVAEQLRLDLALREQPEPVAALLQASGVAFDAELPNGRDTPLAHLGAADDGDFVQVEGFVVEATADREADGKLVGRLVVQDASSQATAELATVFLHPPHVGITLGCYLVAHGIFRVSSARLQGRPGVEVDALAPAALGQAAWQARLWFTAGRWLDMWRSNLNLCWSLGGHTAGPDDSEEPTRGAAELIYAPFAR
ncbi:MAG: hypothetical protein GEU93_11645 [Propionibacteriales bacterium]|nr:hypothetical protein [Propionibacteriales bacterium]